MAETRGRKAKKKYMKINRHTQTEAYVNLITAMEEKEMNQLDIAIGLNLTKGTVSRTFNSIKKGIKIREETAKRYASFIGIDYKSIMN